MSRVRTTAQAQGLQRCSTHLCDACDRQGRCYGDFAVAIERWHLLGDDKHWRAHGFDGPVMTLAPHVIRRPMARTCAKHKSFAGVFTRWIEPNGSQMNRVIVG